MRCSKARKTGRPRGSRQRGQFREQFGRLLDSHRPPYGRRKQLQLELLGGLGQLHWPPYGRRQQLGGPPHANHFRRLERKLGGSPNGLCQQLDGPQTTGAGQSSQSGGSGACNPDGSKAASGCQSCAPCSFLPQLLELCDGIEGRDRDGGDGPLREAPQHLTVLPSVRKVTKVEWCSSSSRPRPCSKALGKAEQELGWVEILCEYAPISF